MATAILQRLQQILPGVADKLLLLDLVSTLWLLCLYWFKWNNDFEDDGELVWVKPPQNCTSFRIIHSSSSAKQVLQEWGFQWDMSLVTRDKIFLGEVEDYTVNIVAEELS
jgi:hypothetical protein